MKINEIDQGPNQKPDTTVIDRPGIATVDKSKEQVKQPNMYEVLIYNDDYTHAEYVVDMLHRHFQKSLQEAIGIMIEAHRGGNATVGIYPKDVAETKVTAAMAEARSLEHPLHLEAQPI